MEQYTKWIDKNFIDKAKQHIKIAKDFKAIGHYQKRDYHLHKAEILLCGAERLMAKKQCCKTGLGWIGA